MALKLYFNEELHKYYDEYGREYRSVTTFIGDYHEEFDTIKMARNCYKAGLAGNTKYKGKSEKQILYEWEQAKIKGCTTGTVKHGYLETMVKTASGFKPTQGKYGNATRLYTVAEIIKNPGYGLVDINYFIAQGLDIKYPVIFQTIEYLASLGYRFYAEIGVFNPEFLISGCIDLFAIKGNKFIIIDWKTNKAPLRFEGGYHEKNREGLLTGNYIITGKKMLQPIGHLEASDGIKYTLQLSSYGRLAEYFGLEVEDLLLFHIITNQITNEEHVDFHPISYYKREVEAMFAERKKRVGVATQIKIPENI